METEKIVGKIIIAKMFPNLMENLLSIPQRRLKRTNKQKTLSYIIAKLLDIKNEEEHPGGSVS